MNKIITNIDIDTAQLSCKQIQDVLFFSRQYKKSTEHSETDNWNRISEVLWAHVNKGLEKLDDQLLCTTCFFSVLKQSDRQHFYLNLVRDIIEKEIRLKLSENENNNSFLAVSLMYGIFQSSLLVQVTDISEYDEVLKSIFTLLILMGYEYSQYTFIVFKIMNSLKKVCGTELQEVIFSEQNQTKLLNLIIHNWENPITGVRDLNKDIFRTLLTILNEDKLNKIVQEINNFYWNKAKYLMLSEIIYQHNGDIQSFIHQYNVLDGLINSLYKPGLVSAGTDVYFAILNKIHSEEIWCKIFFKNVIQVLKGSSSKTIENFTNYWCLMTFKQFPSLMNILISKLQKLDDRELTLYGMISLMKQGSKQAILNINWDEMDDDNNNYGSIILRALENHNTQIRMLAFDIICTSQGKTFPSQVEYNLILEYIQNNINSDCTVLRINMLNSLDAFLGQLHLLFKNTKDDENINIFIDFFNNLQELVITSLNLNGNYQRRFTNVKLIKIIIVCLTEVPRKKKNYAKANKISLREYLEANKYWILHDEDFVKKLFGFLKDPSDDIRENVGSLLLNYYPEQMRLTVNMNGLIQDALQSMKSKYFFEISCGQSMFKVLVSLLLREEHNEAIFKSVNDVFDYALKQLCTQYNLKQNIVKSIEEGKQLHSFISILQVVLDASHKQSYKLNVSEEKILNLLEVLQGITEQFIFEQENSTSSDFSKINEVIEDIIAEGGNSQNFEDITQISGLHQIVLNCLWLNVKASCDLASLLIRYHKDDIEKCEKCLIIITHVLETSRHKGAIEAAGSSLGNAIQFLTTLPQDSNASKLPQTLLKSKLDTLILEASKMASITRRGAGLSIMVHRIVSSDMRKGKPLFHYFIKTLLTTCQDTMDIPSFDVKNNIENQKDLPKAILIHFLSRIVTDSSLASDMMYYSAELGELAFSNLRSPHWQIRNAALQLYGALIPKLIGQKKQSGVDDEIMSTVAYDELRTHSPKLWKFFTDQLKHSSHTEKIKSHSNLVPVLNMLASCAKRYNFSDDLKGQMLADKELLTSFFKVLDSPIHTVRRLTAKCIFNMFTFESIYEIVMKLDLKSENLFHGVLLLLKTFKKYCSLPLNSRLEEMVHCRTQKDKCSYCSKEVFALIYCDIKKYCELQSILTELHENINAPGVYLWAQTCIKNCVMNSSWDDIPRIVDQLLIHKNLEMSFDILLLKLDSEGCDSEVILRQIVISLLETESAKECGVIWQILYEISQRAQLNNIDFTTAINIILSCNGKIPSNIKYIIPFTVKYIENFDNDLQQCLVDIIYNLSNFEIMDVDMRYIAALANNELANTLCKVSDYVKMTSIKTAIVLLQDEDEDVRNLTVNYYKNIQTLEEAVHPTISLCKMLDYYFLCNVLGSNENVTRLCDDLLLIKSNKGHNVTDEYNPFANDAKNIYMEIDVFHTSVEYLKLVASCQ